MINLENINLIIIHPIGRSGSVFVQSLLDNHSNLLGLPSFGPIFKNINNTIKDLNSEINNFINNNLNIFDSSIGYFGIKAEFHNTRKFGSNFSQDIMIDKTKFKNLCFEIFNEQGFKKNENLSRKNFFKIIHIAYAKCFKKIDDKLINFIVYHPHQPIELDILIKEFPELFIIVTTRDPRQNWLSFRKVLINRYGKKTSQLNDLNILHTAKSLTTDTVAVYKIYKKIIKERFILIDLVDLHKGNIDTMKFLCKKFGVKFENSMLDSTFNGLVWGGNAANKKTINGFKTNMKDIWESELTKSEIIKLTTLHYGIIKVLNYEEINDHNNELKKILEKIAVKNKFFIFDLLEIYSSFICLFSPIASSNSYKYKEIFWRIMKLIKSLFFTKRISNKNLSKYLNTMLADQKYLYQNDNLIRTSFSLINDNR